MTDRETKISESTANQETVESVFRDLEASSILSVPLRCGDEVRAPSSKACNNQCELCDYPGYFAHKLREVGRKNGFIDTSKIPPSERHIQQIDGKKGSFRVLHLTPMFKTDERLPIELRVNTALADARKRFELVSSPAVVLPR